jgi:D-proline reductase (dithiol) PrdB
MLNIARRCVPFTPFDKDLFTATVALVSATGVYGADQEAFPTVDPGDISYRIIEGSTETKTLRIAHNHYDHSEADADSNIVFPLDTLRELVSEGFTPR